jgi:hypothetical protein
VKQFLTAFGGIIALGLVVASLFIFNFVAVDGGFGAVSDRLAAPDTTALDLELAANRAEAAAEAVFNGLDTTKELIGKTEARNQAIEGGRKNASQKLFALANRVRDARQSGEPLPIADKRILLHLQGTQEPLYTP